MGLFEGIAPFYDLVLNQTQQRQSVHVLEQLDGACGRLLDLAAGTGTLAGRAATD